MKIVVNKADLLYGLECARLIAFESNNKNPVQLEIKGNKVTIKANTERNTLHDEIWAIVVGENLNIAFNPRYLIDALKAIEDKEIILQFNSATKPCIIKSAEGDGNYIYLVLPLRV